MISDLRIENFKCFTSLRLSLGALTLLTGFNAAGKSSALQPLLLLAQAAKLNLRHEPYSLNGALVRLGSVGDVLPTGTQRADFRVGLTTEAGTLTWTMQCRAGDRQVQLRELLLETPDGSSAPAPSSVEEQLFHTLSGVSFVGAVRGMLADAYPIPDADHQGWADVGVDGRFAAFWYARRADDELVAARRCPGEATATSLRQHANAWFATLFPGAQIHARLDPDFAGVHLQFRTSDTGEWRRPSNVGYGLSYAFPVLVALLTAAPGQLVVVDSPEAHLHPKAQSAMGHMLAAFAAAGVQIVVETHSDHLLNGIRLAVKEGVLAPPDRLTTHFFTGATAQGHGVISPVIDRKGNLSDWPTGFFDQAERDLATLAGWE
ncbi:AAA family ATPase [Roseateles sp. SL47]|uniref:AAA family ATPase n=1 Tax=Roseateles sp. SL47 TaxID=2995138 RepID=UPI003B63A01C